MQQIVDFSKYQIVEVDKLRRAEWNYKQESEFLTEKLQANLERNGQMENILVRELDDETYEVVNGNHRYDALQRLGVSKIVAYNLGKISKQEAMRIAVETNETKFHSDQIKLGEIVAEIAQEFQIDDLKNTLPFSAQEIENFINIQEFDWADYDKSGRTRGASGQSLIEETRQTLKIVMSEAGMDLWHKFVEKMQDVNESVTEADVLQVALLVALQGSMETLEKALDEAV